MKVKKKLFYPILALILVAGMFFGYQVAAGPGKYDDFAKCLAEEGAVFYGAF